MQGAVANQVKSCLPSLASTEKWMELIRYEANVTAALIKASRHVKARR